MKKEIHPANYRPVLFIDNSNGEEFIIPSTVETTETAKAKTDKKPARPHESGAGGEYPVFRVEISSTSHPFYTGEVKVLDTAGRVERFKQRQAKANLPARTRQAGK
ncbi:MAG: type B 50S ribosomal protein L31, partial [bacterium]